MADRSVEAATSRPVDRYRSSAGLGQLAWDRFRANRVAVVALVAVALVILFTLSAGLVERWTGYGPSENDLAHTLSHPGENGHILGTDGNGRDILVRLAYGGRISLMVATLATLSTLLIGGTVGAVSGYAAGRWPDHIAMRFADVLLSIPSISLLILVSTLYKPGPWGLAIIIALVGWPGVSRLVRGDVLSLRNRDFVDAARVAGARDSRIISRHILPNALPTMIVWASQVIPAFVVTEAALSFLGLGVRPPTPSWGNMLFEAQAFYRTNPTNVIFPGFLIFLTALGINLVGNGLRDAFDPRLDGQGRPG